MKKIFSILMVFMAVSAIQAQDFRKASWGMSKTQVKAIETLAIVEEDPEFIFYETTLAGHDVYLGYFFINEKLTRARYVINEIYMNKQEYIEDYKYLNAMLVKKYGEPSIEEEIWRENSTWKDDKAFALSVGDLEMFTSYSTPKSTITMILYSEDLAIGNIIEYSSTDPEINTLEEEKILEAF